MLSNNMSGNNKLVIAAAGSGKTTLLVNEALKKKDGKILITTYTQANEEEIKRKFIKINKCIPENVTVQTWFSFLLQHGARPFQGCKFKDNINGLFLVNRLSAKDIPERDTQNHYFTKNQKIYSDKLSKFVVKCNEQSNGFVVDRLSRIYTDIFIDEVQDLASYDLDFLKLLFEANINILLIGDPRQTTYLTHHANRYKKYKDGKIEQFIKDECKKCFDQKNIKDDVLTINYRSCLPICELSNKLYPDSKKTTSGNTKNTGHDGVFFIKTRDIETYLAEYKPIQLRWDTRTSVHEKYRALTFGLSKGLEFDRVVVYPTPQFIAWIKDNSSDLAPVSRSKLYVAVTRAKFSLAIVCDEDLQIDGIEKFINTNFNIK